MATRTNLPAAEVDGTPLPASWLNDLRGAFRILQVVQGFSTTQVASTSTTWVDTTLSATITPQSTSSRVLVVISQNVYTQGVGTGAGIRLDRNGTVLRTEADISYGTNSGILAQHSFIYFDSPASTSALTYKTQQNRGIGASTVFTQVNTSLNTGVMMLFEVSA